MKEDVYMTDSSTAVQLDNKFNISRFRLISVTGGGGKTSLVFALGKYFANRERTVITTTTKMYRPDESLCDSLIVAPIETCSQKISLMKTPSLTVAAKENLGEKIIGFSTDETEFMLAKSGSDKIIVEADGSRGMSLKAYESWEPPVPPSTECQIVVLGADVLCGALTNANTFRFDILNERYSICRGEKISASNLAAMLSSRSEYLRNSPKNAYRILFINKAELLSDEERESFVRNLKEKLSGYDEVTAGSLQTGRLW